MDKAKQQHNNILLAVAGFAIVVGIVAFIGFLALGRDPEVIQGEMEVEEYRVSGKVPGRILELRVKEGDMVQAGDTLAIINRDATSYDSQCDIVIHDDLVKTFKELKIRD